MGFGLGFGLLSGLGFGRARLGDAEVAEAHHVLAREEDVLRLEVAMEHLAQSEGGVAVRAEGEG